MTRRKRFKPSVYAAILERQEHQCTGCQRPLGMRVEYDHVTALADGGEDCPDNLEACCTFCHKAKSSREATARAKVKRIHAKADGTWRPKRARLTHPRLKKKVNGEVVPRDPR